MTWLIQLFFLSMVKCQSIPEAYGHDEAIKKNFAHYPEHSIFNITLYLQTKNISEFNSTYHLQIKGISAISSLHPDHVAAKAHWISRGIVEGNRFHSGKRILKIVLMTMNEWPLLKSWVLYHGSIFGFENLYILDSSIDANCISFLKRATASLGVHVFFSAGNLNTAASEISIIFHGIRKSCDFAIKLDTDEFLGMYVSQNKSFMREEVVDYIDILPYDGRMYKVGWIALNVINQSCSLQDDVALTSEKFMTLTPTTFKSFFAAWTFQSIDLGSHYGRVQTFYDSETFHSTNLAIYHYHNQCLERYIQNHRKAIVQHGYILANDTKEMQLEKLTFLTANFTKSVSSIHKVAEYCQYLRDSVEFRRIYYNDMQPKENSMVDKDMQRYIASLHHKYKDTFPNL